MVDFRKLEALVALMESGNFSKAAEKIHLTQPTISGHIKALEVHWGLKLFDRHTRTVTPTRAGKVVYRYAQKLLLLYRELEKELAYFKGLKTGKLDLGGSTIPGQYILPYLITAFRKAYPGLSVFLKVGDTAEIIREVQRGTLEMGMVGDREEDPELIFKPCCEDQIVLIGPAEEDFSAPLELKDLLQFPFVGREAGSGTWRTVTRALYQAGLDPDRLRVVAEMGSTEAVKEAVKAGLGLAFVSFRSVEKELPDGRLRLIPIKDFSLKREFYLVFPAQRTLSPPAQTFLHFSQEI